MTGLFAAIQDNSRLQAAFDLARTANTNREVNTVSGLRLVSLPRLEQHLAQLKAEGQAVPEDAAALVRTDCGRVFCLSIPARAML
jgi:hypothetical protein